LEQSPSITPIISSIPFSIQAPYSPFIQAQRLLGKPSFSAKSIYFKWLSETTKILFKSTGVKPAAIRTSIGTVVVKPIFLILKPP
jgi:hypothetical protein